MEETKECEHEYRQIWGLDEDGDLDPTKHFYCIYCLKMITKQK